MPQNCQQRLVARLSTPDPICEACEVPQEPPDLQTALRQSKQKPIEVSFKPERQHYPTSYLLAGIQPKEKSHSQRKDPSKQIKSKDKVIKLEGKKDQETVLKETDKQEQQKETITVGINKEEACNNIQLTKSRSTESLTDKQSLEGETMKAKSLSALEDSTVTTCKTPRKERKTHRLGPPSLLSRASRSSSDIHSKTCQVWGTRPIPQPNAFIWVPQLQPGHVTDAMPKLVVEPRPLHLKWTHDMMTLPHFRSREVKLGEDSKSISRYRGYKGSL